MTDKDELLGPFFHLIHTFHFRNHFERTYHTRTMHEFADLYHLYSLIIAYQPPFMALDCLSL